MTDIPIVRAAYLLLYVEVLREIGVPVERELGRSRLPTWIEEAPDAYVSVPMALDWVGRCSRDASVMELGFLAANRSTVDTLRRDVRRALIDAPTGFARIETIARLAHLEDTTLSMQIRHVGGQVRVVCEVVRFSRSPFFGFAEWLNLQAIVGIVRSVAGPAWCPAEMTFVSRSRLSDAALEAYPDTRILLGQPFSSIVVPAELLARSCHDRATAGAEAALPNRPPLGSDLGNDDFIRALGSAIQPYLGEGCPELALAAEIAGMSKRTLQRRLQNSGRTYSEVVQKARFDIARDLLSDTSLKIIDVAFAAGYENPQHFSRAFRRFAGVTPTTYRNVLSVA